MRLVFLVCLLVSLSVHAEFLSGTDVPLMDGFVMDENDSFSFDTPAGQIMRASGSTNASQAEVLSFYYDSLTALGWQQKSKTTYKRDQDELVVQVLPSGKKTIVRLQLTFANK